MTFVGVINDFSWGLPLRKFLFLFPFNFSEVTMSSKPTLKDILVGLLWSSPVIVLDIIYFVKELS